MTITSTSVAASERVSTAPLDRLARPLRVFTGVKPTGRLTLGNYLGAIRPLLGLAADPTVTVTACIADLHALTVDIDPSVLYADTLAAAATLTACGLGDDVNLFVQSHVGAHPALSYLLESTATHGEMARMVQFKVRAAASESLRLSMLTYPALMAADILAHQAHLVPVGADQAQHLQLTATLARRFNSRYGPCFTVPEAYVPADAARVRDLRDPTAKMGKSGAEASGIVFLADDADTVAAKLRRAVTDDDRSLHFDPQGRPGVANLAAIAAALLGCRPADVLAGLGGASALKKVVVEAVNAELDPIRSRLAELAADPVSLEERLRVGAARVAPQAEATERAARAAMGLLPAHRTR